MTLKFLPTWPFRPWPLDHVTLSCVFTGREQELAASSVVLVTSKSVADGLYQSLLGTTPNLSRIGDCYGPGTIAAAVHSGRKLAENFGSPGPDFLDMPYLREVTELS